MNRNFVFFISLSTLFVLLLCPDIHWLDSSELTLAAFSQGIAHPPGEVPYVMLAKAFQWIPLGSVAFRTNLFSMACVLLTGLVFLRMSRPKHSCFAYMGLIWATLSLFVVFQAVRAEVYALACFLGLWSIEEQLTQDFRSQMKSCFLAGLTMVLHPIMGLMLIPIILKKQGILYRFTFFVLPCLSLLYLPLRSSLDPVWNFGDPSSFDRLRWFLKGELYPAYKSITWPVMFDHAGDLIKSILNAYSLIPLLLMTGSILFFKKIERHFFYWGLGILLVFILLVRQTNFWPENPDVYGYLNLMVWVMVLMSQACLAKLMDLNVKHARAISFLATTMAILYSIFIHGFAMTSFANDTRAPEHMKYLLSEPTASATVHTASFVTYSLLKYGQVVEGRRPDLNIIYRGDSREKYRRKIEEKDLVELAIELNPEGFYTLRSEDKALLASGFRCQEWFCRKDNNEQFADAMADVPSKRYAYYLERVHKDIQRRVFFTVEPFVLDQILKISYLRSRTGGEYRKQIEEFYRNHLFTLIPETNEYNSIAPR